MLLAYAYNNIDLFFIIFIRIIGFFVMLPIFAGTNIPTVIKIGFSVLVTLIIFSTGIVTEVIYNDSVFAFGYILIKEFVVGLLIAFVAYLFFSVLYIIGQLIDFQIGMSMVSVFDPVSQIQVPITGNLFYFIICLIFVEAGGINYFLMVIYNSFKNLPPGQTSLLFGGHMVTFILNLIQDVFIASVRFSLPVVGAIIVVDVALGILVRAVPQMNIFVVGVPLKLIIGFALLFITTPLFSSIYNYVFNESYRNMLEIIQGMIVNG